MQVKKFEAPTLQEALENVKRELGPEAIILQTKKNKRGFGLMSRASIEVTAAVSERSLTKKQVVETRLPVLSEKKIQGMAAEKQADFYNDYMDTHLEKAIAGASSDRVELGSSRNSSTSNAGAKTQSRARTAVRYADIQDESDSKTMKQSSQNSRIRGYGEISTNAGASSTEISGAQNNTTSAAKTSPSTSAPSSVAQAQYQTELRQLRKMVEELRSVTMTPGPAAGAQQMSSGPFASEELQNAFEQLVVSGMDKRFALSLTRQAGFELGEEGIRDSERVLDQLASEIMNSTEVVSPLAGIQPGSGTPTVIALVGPTGVGKTTTAAKLAAEALNKHGLKVGLINLDHVKQSAFDQMATYSKILNVPFRNANSVEDLSIAVHDFSGLDLIIVDTTGRSQRDPSSLKEIQEMLRSVPEMRTQLVLSATTRDAEMYDMVARFGIFKPQGIIMSKLDEATVYGALFNVPQKAKLPLLYFTTGQRVPEDIEVASRERVAALLMHL